MAKEKYVMVSAQPRFVVKENFTLDNPAVKITWIDAEFNFRFGTKIEDAVSSAQFGVNEDIVTNGDVKREIGLRTTGESLLSQVYAFLRKQSRGQEKYPLLVDCHSNVFYVRDFMGCINAVYARWASDTGGWYIHVQ